MRSTLIVATLIAFAVVAPTALAMPLAPSVEPTTMKLGCHDGEPCDDCPSLEDFEVSGAYDWLNDCRS